MQYRFISILAAGVLVAVTSAAPVPSAEAQTSDTGDPANTIGLGKPSTIITWNKRDDEPSNPDDLQLGPPTTEIIWSKDKKRGVEFGTPKDSFTTIGKPKTVVTWGKEKRDTPAQLDTIDLGEPTTEVSWGKRDNWSKEKRQTLGVPDSETTWGKREVEKPKNSFKLGKATTVVSWS